MRGMNGFESMGGMPGMAERGPRKDPDIEYTLQCSLEDLYGGATKKMKISRTVPGSTGPNKVEETLVLNIKPGWKNKTKITFSEKGTITSQQDTTNPDLNFLHYQTLTSQVYATNNYNNIYYCMVNIILSKTAILKQRRSSSFSKCIKVFIKFIT